jgi:hypothetical protein
MVYLLMFIKFILSLLKHDAPTKDTFPVYLFFHCGDMFVRKGAVMFLRLIGVIILILAVSSPPASAQEYVFYGDAESDAIDAGGGVSSFPPSDYSPYKQQAAPVRRQNTVESLPLYERRNSFPLSPYSRGQQPSLGGVYGYGYTPRPYAAPPFSSEGLPFGFFPGGSFPLPW